MQFDYKMHIKRIYLYASINSRLLNKFHLNLESNINSFVIM